MLQKFKRMFRRKFPKKDMYHCEICGHKWDSGLFTGVYKAKEGFGMLVLDCSKCKPKEVKDVVIKDVIAELDKLKNGDRIKAVIRHVNADLELADAYVFLTNEEHGLLLDSYSELNYNWEIIAFEAVKE